MSTTETTPVTSRRLPIPPAGAFCDHTAMAECHPATCEGQEGCGHFTCPCGIAWDDVFGADHDTEADGPSPPSHRDGTP